MKVFVQILREEDISVFSGSPGISGVQGILEQFTVSLPTTGSEEALAVSIMGALENGGFVVTPGLPHR